MRVDPEEFACARGLQPGGKAGDARGARLGLLGLQNGGQARKCCPLFAPDGAFGNMQHVGDLAARLLAQETQLNHAPRLGIFDPQQRQPIVEHLVGGAANPPCGAVDRILPEQQLRKGRPLLITLMPERKCLMNQFFCDHSRK